MLAKRVLVFGMTNARAGTEAVISNIVSSSPEDVTFDFLMFEEPDGRRELFGGDNRCFLLPDKKTRYFAYRKTINVFFKEHADEYSAVWSNLNIPNNIDVLRLGSRYGIPKRIAHSHNSKMDGNLHQRVLCALNFPKLNGYLTDRWACSREAGEFLFGGEDFKVVPNAVDSSASAFSQSKREELRRSYGMDDKLVIGAVGRLVQQKNHRFLVDLMPALAEAKPEVRLVIVGEGALRASLEERARELGVEKLVVFAGAQEDMQAYLSLFDLFAFPSLFEGLSISLLEAQFNGLPCVIADTVSKDGVISEGVVQLSLEDPSAWVEPLLGLSRSDARVDPKRSRQFDLHEQVQRLSRLF